MVKAWKIIYYKHIRYMSLLFVVRGNKICLQKKYLEIQISENTQNLIDNNGSYVRLQNSYSIKTKFNKSKQEQYGKIQISLRHPTPPWYREVVENSARWESFSISFVPSPKSSKRCENISKIATYGLKARKTDGSRNRKA